MTKEVNNPGNGDCGYYAFAIGLLAIIHEEHKQEQHSKTYDRWQALDNSLTLSLDDVLLVNIGGDSVACSDGLEQLMLSLRRINASALKHDLSKSLGVQLNLAVENRNLKGTLLYGYLAELIDFYRKNPNEAPSKGITDFNPLSHSNEILDMAKGIAAKDKNEQDGQINQVLSLAESKVKIEQAINVLTEKERVWATHSDLKLLAEKFVTNLLVSGEHNGATDKNKPTVELSNKGNLHWVTVLRPVPASEDTNYVSLGGQETSSRFSGAANKALFSASDRYLKERHYLPVKVNEKNTVSYKQQATAATLTIRPKRIDFKNVAKLDKSAQSALADDIVALLLIQVRCGTSNKNVTDIQSDYQPFKTVLLQKLSENGFTLKGQPIQGVANKKIPPTTEAEVGATSAPSSESATAKKVTEPQPATFAEAPPLVDSLAEEEEGNKHEQPNALA